MMKNEMWMAVFSNESGSEEFVVLFEDKPSDETLREYYEGGGINLDGLYEFAQLSGPSISQLPTDRALSK